MKNFNQFFIIISLVVGLAVGLVSCVGGGGTIPQSQAETKEVVKVTPTVTFDASMVKLVGELAEKLQDLRGEQLAVFGFLHKPSNQEWGIGTQIEDAIIGQLSAKQHKIMERQKLKGLVNEKAMSLSGTRIGKSAGAAVVITGSYTLWKRGESLRITARAIDVQTSAILASVKTEVSTENIEDQLRPVKRPTTAGASASSDAPAVKILPISLKVRDASSVAQKQKVSEQFAQGYVDLTSSQKVHQYKIELKDFKILEVERVHRMGRSSFLRSECPVRFGYDSTFIFKGTDTNTLEENVFCVPGVTMGKAGSNISNMVSDETYYKIFDEFYLVKLSYRLSLDYAVFKQFLDSHLVGKQGVSAKKGNLPTKSIVLTKLSHVKNRKIYTNVYYDVPVRKWEQVKDAMQQRKSSLKFILYSSLLDEDGLPVRKWNSSVLKSSCGSDDFLVSCFAPSDWEVKSSNGYTDLSLFFRFLQAPGRIAVGLARNSRDRRLEIVANDLIDLSTYLLIPKDQANLIKSVAIELK